MNRATTFDLVIMDISINLEKHFNSKSDPNYIPNVSEEELLKIKARA
jgi:hypothetical protein